MKIIWKDIEEYENLYQVSNTGEFRSLSKNNIVVPFILKPYEDKKGYLRVGLRKNEKTKTFLRHRLVAKTFLENKNYYRCVNHLDGDKKNNNVKNLEWCTHKQNTRHAIKIGLFKSHIGPRPWKRKKILQFTKQRVFLKRFSSITEAANETGISRSAITSCLRKKTKTSGGFKWKYVI